MKQLLILFSLLVLVLGTVGCSDDESNPVTPPTTPTGTSTSTWSEDGSFWMSTVDASDYDDYMHFSFTTLDTVTGAVSKTLADSWDIAFRREVIKLNGGTSTVNDGDVEGADLGLVNYFEVTIDDTAGVTWVSDFIDFFIDEWYVYNPTTHQLTMNQYVYSMLDASGEHYVKFQVDSIVGAGQPPSMGTVWLKYYYQDTVGVRRLAGDCVEASIDVGSEVGYFDFSTGAEVSPADPSDSDEWDIAFYAYDIMQNSGPNGTGECAAFLAWGELDDPTDIDAFIEQPTGAPLFPDIPGSALTEWYNYNGTTHQLSSKSHVYLIRTGQIVYKLRIESYYEEIGGVPVSAHYTYIWNEL